MKANPIQKIAIVGPESTGKTTLAMDLAHALHTQWVPEYARTYLEQLERPYERKDLVDIAKGQLRAESKALSQAQQWLICDTNLLVVQIWEEYKYGALSPSIEALINLSDYQLHFLTSTDLPWAPDPQRENPDLNERKELFDLYEAALIKAKVPYVILSGTREKRLQQALQAIQHLPF
ncbi:MAG: ATP-binding protein [Bacteroidota bacterium]